MASPFFRLLLRLNFLGPFGGHFFRDGTLRIKADSLEQVHRAIQLRVARVFHPFAVAIARFRLTVAALRASGLDHLEHAPAFRYHLAAGDSLLHGVPQQTPNGKDTEEALSSFTYASEDLDALREILRPGWYDVVVANPPYITVKDTALVVVRP